MPERPDGRCSRMPWVEGKTVERVPRGVRWRIRRAMTADSYEVGILKACSQEGLVKMCSGAGREVEVTRGSSRGRTANTYILG